MRALIATGGSDGDLRPFYALAKELLGRGHEVLFTGPDYYTKPVEALGIPFRKVGPTWGPDQMRDAFEQVLKKTNPLDQLKIVLDTLVEPELAMVHEYLEMVPQYDVVIYPPIFFVAAAAARAKGVKHVSVQLAPVHPARNYSPTGSNFGPFLNGIVWKLALGMLRRATDDKLNTIVKASGLAPWKDVLLKATTSDLLDLIAVSPNMRQADPGWPASSRLTGYWFLDEPDFKVDPALETFVGNDRPVVVGFGSMNGFDAKKVTETIMEAARTIDRKVVVQSGWAGLGDAEIPSNVFVARFVPHTWLFSRASCVVHHGGAGTTAAALRAGIPQMIVWHLGDQPSWGQKVRGHGIGPAHIFHQKMTTGRLAAGIRQMLTDEPMKQRPRALGEQVRGEKRGVATAVRMIEGAFDK